MPDYHKAIIYTIKTGNNLYVGSTTNFADRKKNHKCCINSEIRINNNSKLYIAIRKNGGDWKMEKYKDYPCENKLQLEIEEEKVKIQLNADLNSQICNTGMGKKEYDKYRYRNAENKQPKKQPFYKNKERKQLCKEVFLWKFNKHFRFMKSNTNYIPKKVVCDLMDLDYKSKKDIRYLNNMLMDYGVEYDSKKMINRDRGVFMNIFLNENK